jgi:hypothetical protein
MKNGSISQLLNGSMDVDPGGRAFRVNTKWLNVCALEKWKSQTKVQ